MVEAPIYEQKIVKLTATGANDYLDTDTVRAGELWVVWHAYVVDVNNTVTDVRVGPYNGADHFWLHGSAITTANVGEHFKGPFYVREGQKFRAHFIGATSGDDLYFIFQYEKIITR